jgi:hypothetical protein
VRIGTEQTVAHEVLRGYGATEERRSFGRALKKRDCGSKVFSRNCDDLGCLANIALT